MSVKFLIQAVSTLTTDASALESSILALKSSISALESSIKTLDDSSALWDNALPWFTGAVVVGVLMEGWTLWEDRREDLEAWALTHFGVNRLPTKPSLPKFWVEVISLVLVTLGILGELGVGVKISSISSELRSKGDELRSKSDQLLALVTEQAGSAAKSAKSASDAASGAKEKADAAGKEADIATGNANAAQGSAKNALLLVGKAQAEADSLEASLVIANQKISAEQEKRLALQISLAPRDLPAFTGDDGKPIFVNLLPFSGTKAFIEYVPDVETMHFAEQVEDVLIRSGWVIKDFSPVLKLNDGVTVLRYSVPSTQVSDASKWTEDGNSRSANASQVLVDFLNGCSIQAYPSRTLHGEVAGMTLPDSDSVRIWIGFKPMPYAKSEMEKQMNQMAAKMEKKFSDNKKIANPPCHPDWLK